MTNKTKLGDMRVWWIPQVPGKPFHVAIKNTDEAILLLNALADYDIFQFKNKIKPDYCNAGGLEVLEDNGNGCNEWCEWNNEEGEDIDRVMEIKEAA